MDASVVAIAGFAALFLLIVLRVPVGVAMGIVGVLGFGAMTDIGPALKLLGQVPLSVVTDQTLIILPMFILMGVFATATGMNKDLFRAGNAWFGHFRGGIGMATLAASAGFSAINGSSIATASTMTLVALPEMRAKAYDPAIGTGIIAAGGTLGIMIPPSAVLVLYGVLTRQDISVLFVAGVLPGLLGLALYCVTVHLIARFRADMMPRGDRARWTVRLRTLGDIWAIVLLFLFVLGGMYGGAFTVNEAAGMGAAGMFVIGLVQRRFTVRSIIQSLVTALRTTAAIFMIVIGAFLFGYFLTVTQATQSIAEFLTTLPIGAYGVLSLILLGYIILGAIMDELAIVLLTVPIVYPVIVELGFDPVWFGVIIVMTVTLGLNTPPIGMNVFVINSIAADVGLGRIYRGVTPFVLTDMVRLILLCAFPAISLVLPRTMN